MRAKQMVVEGADIIDIGGESSRPGAQKISIEEELQRVLPIIEILTREISAPISIDTCKPMVMKAAIDAGVDLINDIYALQMPGALEIVAQCDLPICLMHMQGEPDTMQRAPQYNDIVKDMKSFFQERIEACELAGIKRERLILDPGFGFGKTVQHNAELTRNLAEFKTFGLPLLFGASRKASIGAILDKPPTERLYGSLAAAVIAVMNGAKIIRVHDVMATNDALKVCAVFLLVGWISFLKRNPPIKPS